MNIHQLIEHVELLLEAVPFSPVATDKYLFDVYKVTPAEMNELELNEENWDQKFPITTNKLFKLGVSFGNLVKLYRSEKETHDLKMKREAQYKSRTQSTDPFADEYVPKKGCLHSYQIRFAQNLFHILKNFDVAAHQQRQRPHPPVDSDTFSVTSPPYSMNNSSSNITASPIKLSSKQLLIEKLEVNIKLDALFTFKIILKLIIQLYSILADLLSTFSDDATLDTATISNDVDSASMYSGTSYTLSGQFMNSNISTDEYLRLVTTVCYKINVGIVEPFTNLILSQVVDTKVTNSFQSLLSSI